MDNIPPQNVPGNKRYKKTYNPLYLSSRPEEITEDPTFRYKDPVHEKERPSRSKYPWYDRVWTTARKRWNNPDPIINQWARGLGAAGGAYLGGASGAQLGSEAADLLHRAFKTVTGYGDYYVNGVRKYPKVDSLPRFKNYGRQTRVRHREYIQDITSSSTALDFKVTTLSINPGIATTFPWLSTIAQNYEEYRIRGMLFEFKSTSSDSLNSTNTSLGTVVMASQYNVLQPPFNNKQQMENYEFSAAAKPSQSLLHAIECNPRETPSPELFVRTSGQSVTGSDLRLYDHANFSIATTGVQGLDTVLGELWVTYDIELLKPKMSAQMFVPLQDYFSLASISSTNPLGTAATPDANNTLGCVVDVAAKTITLPNSFTGNIILFYAYSVSGSSDVAPGINLSSSLTWHKVMDSGTINYYKSTGANVSYFGTIYSTGGGVITFTVGTVTTSSGGDLFISSSNW